jgi:hypothetical protein
MQCSFSAKNDPSSRQNRRAPPAARLSQFACTRERAAGRVFGAQLRRKGSAQNPPKGSPEAYVLANAIIMCLNFGRYVSWSRTQDVRQMT